MENEAGVSGPAASCPRTCRCRLLSPEALARKVQRSNSCLEGLSMKQKGCVFGVLMRERGDHVQLSALKGKASGRVKHSRNHAEGGLSEEESREAELACKFAGVSRESLWLKGKKWRPLFNHLYESPDTKETGKFKK